MQNLFVLNVMLFNHTVMLFALYEITVIVVMTAYLLFMLIYVQSLHAQVHAL